MTDLPQAWVDAAANALWRQRNRNTINPSSPGPDGIDAIMATAMLEAATPLIAAAERERIHRLAVQHNASCILPDGPFGTGRKVPFADLLRETQ
jgi:hypothetical protein